MLTEDEDATGRELQQELLAMQFNTQRSDDNDDSDISFTAEAYRHAAFIYLYRTWLGVGAPNPISVEHMTGVGPTMPAAGRHARSRPGTRNRTDQE